MKRAQEHRKPIHVVGNDPADCSPPTQRIVRDSVTLGVAYGVYIRQIDSRDSVTLEVAYGVYIHAILSFFGIMILETPKYTRN